MRLTSSLDAARAVEALAARGLTCAVAESLTGGVVCAALTAPPGASALVRGGVVAYHADLKREVLSVPAALIEAQGTVCDDVALAMADGVRSLARASVAVATTGVAGPGEYEGKPPGRVHIAAVSDGARLVQEYSLVGDRASVVAQASALAIDLLEQCVLLTPQAGRREGEQV